MQMPTQVETPLILAEDFTVAGRPCALWTLNRPDKRNPIDARTLRSLRGLLTEAQDADLAAIVITGAGAAFSAGGDLKAYKRLFRDREALARFMEDFEAVCEMLERGTAFAVAMINGTCVAGGLEIALACDVITVADDVTVGDGHLRFALLPGVGGGQRLVRAIGYAHAKRWLLSGRLYPASELVRVGLVDKAVPRAELREHTEAIIADVVTHSPLAVAEMKRLVRDSADVGLTAGLHLDRRETARYILDSHDATEGITAFAERRPPRFLGR